MRVCVVGLGKLGLPVAVQIAAAGHRVRGVDIDPQRVHRITCGDLDGTDEPGLKRELQNVLEAELFSAGTATQEAVRLSEAVLIIVPVLVDNDRRPHFELLDNAVSEIGRALEPGTIVSVETTVPVGTTRNRIGPLLERVSGLNCGNGFYLVHSPERVSVGSVFKDLRSYPKLVGGTNHASTDAGSHMYEQILTFTERSDLGRPNGVWPMDSSEATELTKLAETTYRSVNIALANEFAKYSAVVGVDIHEVIEAANSQPYSHIHSPGVSVGGHCIPVYPHLYMAGDDAALLPGVGVTVNESMPAHLAETAAQILGTLTNMRIGILGLSYRPGVKEAAFSGALPLARELVERGAQVFVDDPLFEDSEIRSLGLSPMTDRSQLEAVVLHTAHDAYRLLGPEDFPNVELVLDGRNFLKSANWIPVPLYTLGKPFRG